MLLFFAQILMMLDVHDPHDLLRLAIQEASVHEILAECSELLCLSIIEIDSQFKSALPLNASKDKCIVNPDWESVQAEQNFTLCGALPSNGLLAMEENQRLVSEVDQSRLVLKDLLDLLESGLEVRSIPCQQFFDELFDIKSIHIPIQSLVFVLDSLKYHSVLS